MARSCEAPDHMGQTLPGTYLLNFQYLYYLYNVAANGATLDYSLLVSSSRSYHCVLPPPEFPKDKYE
jgi:hypothetical protein